MERFQKKKPNKDDHKAIKRVAGGMKKGAQACVFVLAAGKVVKDHGKDIANMFKNTVLKR